MRQFYVSLITSSFICLSIASASSILEETQTASTSSTSLSATTSQAAPKDDLTSFTDRLKVVREYYGEKPFNKDPTIFTHIAKWHNQDVKAIASRLTSEENRAKLSKFSAVMAQTFDRGEASFAKVSAAYLLYARVLSRDIEPCTDSAVLDYHAKQNQSVLRYIQDGSLDGFYNDWVVEDIDGFVLEKAMLSYDEIQAKDSVDRLKREMNKKFFKDEFFDHFKRILLVSKLGIRPLPMVSETGLASYEELDDSFGLGTPLLGMPWKRGNFDGNFDVLPEGVFGHDVDHIIFNETIEYTDVGPFSQRYALYRQFNKAIGQNQDQKRRFLSHFFLFEIGHERGFVDQKSRTFGPDGGQPLLDKNTAERVFQDYIEETLQNMGTMFDVKPFASLWASPLTVISYENGQKVTQVRDENYYRTQSVWRCMVNESTGNLYSPEEMFSRFDIDRTSYIRGIHIISAINKKMGLNLTLPQEVEEFDFERDISVWLNAYNTLLENQTYFQQNGLTDFQVWKGDKINVEGMKVQLQKAVDVFKQDVLPKL